MDKLTPKKKELRARMGAHALHALHDSRELTKPARDTFNRSFELKVDPTGELPPEERARRAEHARKQHYAEMAYRSARARRKQAEARTKAKARACKAPTEASSASAV